MPDPCVFVSHSTKDAAYVETKLLPLLHAHGIATWYSKDDIATSTDWEAHIRVGLTSSDWFLLVMSASSERSEWVKSELHWAIAHRPGRIVPVMIESCEPANFHLGLPRIQFVDFRNDMAAASAKLLAIWNPLTQHVSSPVTPAPDHFLRRWKKSGALWTVAAVLLGSIALLSTIGVDWLRGAPEFKPGAESTNSAVISDVQDGTKPADDPPDAKPSTLHKDDLRRFLADSVFLIESIQSSERSQASGFFVSEQGRLVTPSFALSDSTSDKSSFIMFENSALKHSVDLLRRNDDLKLAVLQAQLDRDVKPLKFADGPIAPGAKIFAMGHAGSSGWIAAEGAMIGTSPGPDGYNLIKTDIQVLLGMAGGPAVNERGELVGMIIGGDKNGLGFLIPANIIRQFLDDR